MYIIIICIPYCVAMHLEQDGQNSNGSDGESSQQGSSSSESLTVSHGTDKAVLISHTHVYAYA